MNLAFLCSGSEVLCIGKSRADCGALSAREIISVSTTRAQWISTGYRK